MKDEPQTYKHVMPDGSEQVRDLYGSRRNRRRGAKLQKNGEQARRAALGPQKVAKMEKRVRERAALAEEVAKRFVELKMLMPTEVSRASFNIEPFEENGQKGFAAEAVVGNRSRGRIRFVLPSAAETP